MTYIIFYGFPVTKWECNNMTVTHPLVKIFNPMYGGNRDYRSVHHIAYVYQKISPDKYYCFNEKMLQLARKVEVSDYVKNIFKERYPDKNPRIGATIIDVYTSHYVDYFIKIGYEVTIYNKDTINYGYNDFFVYLESQKKKKKIINILSKYFDKYLCDIMNQYLLEDYPKMFDIYNDYFDIGHNLKDNVGFTGFYGEVIGKISDIGDNIEFSGGDCCENIQSEDLHSEDLKYNHTTILYNELIKKYNISDIDFNTDNLEKFLKHYKIEYTINKTPVISCIQCMCHCCT
jgi:hypothetical protein